MSLKLFSAILTVAGTIVGLPVCALAQDEFELTVNAGEGGTVEPAGTSSAAGIVNIKATPLAGYGFVKWTGDVPEVLQYDAELALPIDRARTLTATFAQAVYAAEDGSDEASGATPKEATTLKNAVAKAADGSVVVLAAGTHQLSAMLTVDKAITLRGETGNWADVIVRQANIEASTVKITNNGAVLTALTVTNGCSYTDWGTTQAGNVWMSAGGTIANCRVTGNRQASYNRIGAVYSNNGKVYRCVIDGNTNWDNFRGMAITQTGDDAVTDGCIITNNIVSSLRYTGHGTVNVRGGVFRNSLVAFNNIGKPGNAGSTSGVLVEGGVVENCLVYGNSYEGNALSGFVAGVRQSGNGIMRNSIIGMNTNTAGEKSLDWTGSAAKFVNCAVADSTAEMPGSMEFVYGSTLFFAAGGLPVLTSDSPAIDAGAEESAQAADAVDLAGGARVTGEKIDLGPVEYAPSDELVVPFSINVQKGFVPLSVVCTAHPTYAQLETDPVTYFWSFAKNPGMNVSGTDKSEISVTFTEHGEETITLVAKTESGKEFTFSQTVIASPRQCYVVSGNPSAAKPYATWETAAATIPDAIDAAIDGMEIILSNGVHTVSGTLEISKDILVKGFNDNREKVIIDGEQKVARVISVFGKGRLASVTITGGAYNSYEELRNTGVGLLISSEDSVVTNCIIRGNSTIAIRTEGIGVAILAGLLVDSLVEENCAPNNCRGVGVKIAGGTVNRCVIRRNVRSFGCTPINNDWLSSAGVCLYGGKLANSVIAENSLGTVFPAGRQYAPNDALGVLIAGAVNMYNCAVIGNCHETIAATNQATGIFVADNGSRVYNTIVAGNGLRGGPENNAQFNRARFVNCAVPAGETDGMTDPVALASGDYVYDAVSGRVTLPKHSTLIDAGAEIPESLTDFDLAGNPRTAGTAIDIGPVENQGGALDGIFFTADRADGEEAYTAELAAPELPAGVNYAWFANGEELPAFADRATASVAVSAPGVTRITLVATAADGATASFSKDLKLSSPLHYVVPGNPGAASPYSTWATAAASIGDALAVAQDDETVIVSNGVCKLASALAIDRAVTLRGASGAPEDVIIDGDDLGNFGKSAIVLSHSRAVVADLTLSNFTFTAASTSGGVIQNNGGTVRNCRITDSTLLQRRRGAAVQNLDGRVERLRVERLALASGSYTRVDGLALFQAYSTAIADSCIFTGNTAVLNTSDTTYLGALVADIQGGTFRNSIVAGNTIETIAGTDQAAVRIGNGSIENCTIVANACTSGLNGLAWTGLLQTGGNVVNTLIDGNLAPDSAAVNWSAATPASFTSCCTTPVETLGEGCIKSTPGCWSFGNKGSIRMPPSGPCANAGKSLAWHDSATDVYGKPRVKGKIVDIGAIESALNGLTIIVR